MLFGNSVSTVLKSIAYTKLDIKQLRVAFDGSIDFFFFVEAHLNCCFQKCFEKVLFLAAWNVNEHGACFNISHREHCYFVTIIF